MCKADPYTAYQDPDDIHNGTQATRFIWFVNYIFPEWYESQHGKFHGLKSKWNSNNGKAQ